MKKLVVVIFGNKGAGKDTFAEFLADEISYVRGTAVRRTAFAEPLKVAALHLLGIPLEVSNGTQAQKETTQVYGRTVRSWLQWLGTEVGRRGVAESLWVDRLCDLIRAAREKAIVVSDGRFRNELEGPRDRLGADAVVWNVLVRRPSVPPPETDAHPSEREVWELTQEHHALGRRVFDQVVVNDGSKDYLRGRAAILAQELASEPNGAWSPA